MGLRDLPSVDALTARLESGEAPGLPRPLIRAAAREAIDRARAEIASGGTADPYEEAAVALARIARRRPRRVINATGVLLHTNLGRAPVSPDAAQAAAAQHTGYGNLEFDLDTGARGGRGAYLAELLATTTGAAAAMAVNNNAAALLLTLSALAGEGAAAVSRGELIEIGGSFRLPELMRASGARLIEVGTTNRTRPGDYEAVLDRVSLVLKVHPSNYRIEGFSEEVGYAALAEIARRRGIPFVADVGSGLLDTRTPWLAGPPPSWLAHEPGVRQTLEAGADLVLFSGDKLLGGPQAGIVVGDAGLIGTMKRHPIARAVRMDGATAAALAATVEAYAAGTAASLPFWHMATIEYGVLESRARRVLERSGGPGDVVASESVAGAGSVPGESIPSPSIRVPGDPDVAWKGLIAADPPVVGRRREGALHIDLRTVDPADDDAVAGALGSLP